ncbi:AAA domain-containing protein [Jiangella asiatica]|uniref:DNA2/NAM7 helicase-like C-terminal domain-containing protein n=1 Tax=Jiangella asiatica TaxID=2530372 RepID=A0A4R5DBB0_9ACTN|nr:AAA domain-containing protein [Jiangella asiatica]TDE10939.1 hypothetical protein E1269_10680 [Jiangella asiatica]
MSELSIHVRTEPVRERFVAVRPPVAAVPTPATVVARRPLTAASALEIADRADRRRLPAGERAALLVGTAVYDHVDYPRLSTAAAGLRHMQQVLERPDVGMADVVRVVADATRTDMMRAIETFLDERELSDTVLVYLAGYAGVSTRDGRLFLVASDTDPADLEGTAVAADFLRQRLQECRAASKVVLLDHCAAGDEPDRLSVRGREVMPEPAGVYVISASRTLRPAADLADSASTLGTTRFTEEIVEGLLTGRVKSGLGAWVTADDLAAYVVDRLTERGVPADRLPATSTLAVSGNHVIARSAVRALSLLDGDRAAERPVTAQPRAENRHEELADPGWRDVIAYYRACLTEPRAPEVLPSRDEESADWFAIGSGPEVLLSGTEAIARAPQGVDTFDWKERDVWYGYPFVTLAGGGRRHSANPLAPPSVAPLLVRRVEVTVDARGAAALRPTGPVVPHAGVLQACLDDQEAASVLATWRQSWKPGDREQMLAAIRQLMGRLGLTELDELEPAELSADDLRTATRTGIHNAACVLYVESDRPTALAVSAELGSVADHRTQIPGTALEYLGKPVGLRRVTGTVPPPVLPAELDESQQAVLTAAMTRPLTVAAAPPGTGKERLIVDVVATAVAAGQKVLVTSTDDAALHELARRCGALAPGLLIKTGDAQARAEEKQLVRELLRSTKGEPRGRRRSTVEAELAAVRDDLHEWRRLLRERNAVETRLRKTTAARAAAAGRLGLSVGVLGQAWREHDAAMREWIDRARELTDVKFLGGFRRRSLVVAYLRALGEGGIDAGSLRRQLLEPAAFDSLLLFARAEQRLREDRWTVEQLGDDLLDAQGRVLTERFGELSAELMAVVVAEQAAAARDELTARRRALEPGGKDRPASQRHLLDHLGGWAVTVDAAQQLALEPGMFDLVVLDDAHRCSVAEALPVLFRARRALVIGDPRLRPQQPPLSDHRIRKARENAGLSAAWLEHRRLSFGAHSAYDAALGNVDRPILLDQHDGSHPGIARIVDEHFYDARLTVVTDVSGLRRATDAESGEATLLLWEDVNGAPERGLNGGSWRNQAEIDRVVWAVNELRDQLPKDAAIAVVTPFRAQAEELRSLFRFEPVRVVSVDDAELAACDAVVLSLVAGEDMPEQTVRWVQAQADLWNAALGAARSHVVTVGQHGFWSRRSGLPELLARRSSVRSFHVHPIPPAFAESGGDVDPLVDLLCERLTAAGHDVTPNAVVDGYRCDALVRTPDETVAVLLDRGWPADQDASRHARLLLLRRRLLLGLSASPEGPSVTRVLRVPTWQVRSGEPIEGLMA